MTTLNRRRFLQLGGAATTGLGLGRSPGFGMSAMDAGNGGGAADDELVRMSGDGVGLTAAQYSRLLVRLADEKGITPDSYSIGGVVEELEAECARVLGKE